jgi:glutamate racemase
LLYTIPAPELVPLIEANIMDYDKVYQYIDMYAKYISSDTDCLILGCTHYPILLDIFRERFPWLKIIDPGRSTIFTLDKRISLKDIKKTY